MNLPHDNPVDIAQGPHRCSKRSGAEKCHGVPPPRHLRAQKEQRPESPRFRPANKNHVHRSTSTAMDCDGCSMPHAPCVSFIQESRQLRAR